MGCPFQGQVGHQNERLLALGARCALPFILFSLFVSWSSFLVWFSLLALAVALRRLPLRFLSLLVDVRGVVVPLGLVVLLDWLHDLLR